MLIMEAMACSLVLMLLVSGLFVLGFALIEGVHTPHDVILTPMKSVAISTKPGVLLFCEGFG